MIDATAGNGHDTVFLADCVGAEGTVHAFDVQEAAVQATAARVAGHAAAIHLHLESHAEMGQHAAPGTIAAILFNLGYLPGDDHARTTESAETLRALAAATALLKPGGVLSIVCYPGHPAGAAEAAAVETWLAGLTATAWRVAKYGALGTRRPAPFLLLAAKPGATSSESASPRR